MKLLLCLFTLCCFSLFVKASIHVTISNETFDDKSAAFGPKVSVNGRIGYIIEPLEDPHGCSVVQLPCNDWIALVRRGGCSFISKVRHMQESGAIAVIVGDPDTTEWITMYAPGDNSDILIPSVFIPKNEYNKLLQLSKLLGTPMMAILQNNENVIPWPLIDILIIVVLSPCIMLFMIYASWKIKQGVLRRRELAPFSVVSQLTVNVYRINEKNQEPESCAICLEDYETGDELRVLPCNHQFHTVCVDAWLTTQKKLCPICKRDITCNNHVASKNNEVTPLLLEAGIL